jgi:hypothetical protein
MEELGLFKLTFPHLRNLVIHNALIRHSRTTIPFWSRHPNLEVIALVNIGGKGVFRDFLSGLPNLRVLKV